MTLALPHVEGRPRVLFEAGEPTALDWDESARVLRAGLPTEGSAALIAFGGPFVHVS
ncbi:hypothetical protein [Streptomyces sp. SP18BB07]|uniref:hypothetical protein n=1 Tax=Streptomyces sp. SP18BB07 TaxID=3002522 RepID=UPI002E770D12|nr:hypothetical protein [Streptomyces sp. SP18BB07]MEE1761269.1 hypothetical protein [Streptomyces sp. SP18BB07]